MMLPSKKTFTEPSLRVYGDIARITQAVGATGAGDGAGAAMLKTAP